MFVFRGTTTFLTINNSSKNVAKTRKSVAKSLGHGLWSVVYAAVAFSLKLRFFFTLAHLKLKTVAYNMQRSHGCMTYFRPRFSLGHTFGMVAYILDHGFFVSCNRL
jgi:preprotein translocase subunit SecY